MIETNRKMQMTYLATNENVTRIIPLELVPAEPLPSELHSSEPFSLGPLSSEPLPLELLSSEPQVVQMNEMTASDEQKIENIDGLAENIDGLAENIDGLAENTAMVEQLIEITPSEPTNASEQANDTNDHTDQSVSDMEIDETNDTKTVAINVTDADQELAINLGTGGNDSEIANDQQIGSNVQQPHVGNESPKISEHDSSADQELSDSLSIYSASGDEMSESESYSSTSMDESQFHGFDDVIEELVENSMKRKEIMDAMEILNKKRKMSQEIDEAKGNLKLCFFLSTFRIEN